MKITHELRTKLGITQYELAQYLKINRSQLALYEIGTRDLPTSALVQLAEIELFLHEMEKESKTESKLSGEQQEVLLQELSEQQKENEFKLLQAQIQLDTLQKKAIQKQNLTALVDHLSENSKNKDNDWSLQILQVSVPKTLETETILTQMKLQMKLQILYSQSNFITELTKKIQNS